MRQLLLALLLLTPAVAQDVVGTYAIEGRREGAASVYTATMIVERVHGRLAVEFDPPTLPPNVELRDGTLTLRSPGPAAREARYDLAALRGEVTLDGKHHATETLTRLTRLIVLHTNDHHGQLIPFKDPTTGKRVGGLAARATLVERVRAEAARQGALVLVLDAGDVNTGVPESDLLDAIPDLEAMNAIGYQAMAVGNHEFDRGLEVLDRQRRIARFPLLSANVLDEATGEPLFAPAVVLERDGLRVGLLGLTTESAAYITLPECRAGLRFEPALEAAAREVPRLRARCDVLIALTHLGYYPDGNFGTSTPGDVNLVRAVPGIDLVIGGHTHTRLDAPVVDSGVPICQCQDRGRYLGRVDLLLDPQRKVVRHEARLLPVADVPEDPGVLDLLRPFLESVNGRLDEVVAHAPVALDGERPRVRAGDTNLAFLVTDAYRHAGGTDVAFALGGGIRASIDAGPITYREVLTTLPFQNGLVRGRLTGAQVLEVLAIGARQVAPSGGWLQVSGLTWTIEAGAPKDVRVGGAPLDPARVYTVTCDRFMADGGEKYVPLTRLADRELLPLRDHEALARFLRERGVPDHAAQRRLTVRSSASPAAKPPAGR